MWGISLKTSFNSSQQMSEPFIKKSNYWNSGLGKSGEFLKNIKINIIPENKYQLPVSKIKSGFYYYNYSAR